MIQLTTHNEKETKEIAERLSKALQPGAVVAFFGGIGVGKTTFIAGLAKGLEIDDDIHSPTFALVNEYHGKSYPLYHFDMYRIESWDDLYSTGFFDYYDQGGIIACEWSENIENALPENCIHVTIERGDSETDRIITIEGFGKYENIKY